MRRDTLIYFFLLATLLLSCEDSTDPSFSFETGKTIVLEPDDEAGKTFHFSSALSWQATTEADWLEISPTSGKAGASTLTLTAKDANESNDTRRATVLLTSASLKREIIVEQQPSYYFKPEQEVYYIPSEGTELDIRFKTNINIKDLNFYDYSRTEWFPMSSIKIHAIDGEANTYALGITIDANDNKQEREVEYHVYRQTADDEIAMSIIKLRQKSNLPIETSTDYSADKTIRKLQNSTKGKGLPIVIMGDGFIDKEIADGTYDRVMEKAMENFFTEEPVKSLRDYFDVYQITAVSKHNVFGAEYETAFNCQLIEGISASISLNDEAVMEYAECLEDVDIENATVIVIMNSNYYGGSTLTGYSNESNEVTEFSIAACPIIYSLESEDFRCVLSHEAVGHGFAKLEDEYSYLWNENIPSSKISQTQERQRLGWSQNVDFTNSPEKVLWADFLADGRYADEGLGIYEGAATYMHGIYRSSEESMMRSHILGFNAPSRKAIYDAVMRRGAGKESCYEDFVAFDLPLKQQRKAATRSLRSVTEKPLAPPIFKGKQIIRKSK